MTAAGRREWGLIAAYAILTFLAYPPFNLLFPSLSSAWFRWSSCSPTPRQGPIRSGRRRGSDSAPASRQKALLIYWLVAALWHFTPLSALGYVATVVIVGWYTAAQGMARSC